MKTKSSLLAALTIVAAWAQPAERPDSALPADPNAAVQAIAGSAPGRSISRFVGRPVQNLKGQKLGTIKDVLVDVNSGRVVYAAIAAPSDETLRLAPFAALHTDDDANGLKVEIEQAQWQQIQPIKADDFKTGRVTLSGDERRQLAQRFGQAEPPPIDQESTGPVAVNGGSQLVRLGELRGKRITTGSEHIGFIDDVVVDSERMTAAAIVGPEKDFAIASRRFVVPLRHLSLGARDQEPIRTTLTRTDFEEAQQRKSERTEAGQPPSPQRGREPTLSPTGRTDAVTTPTEAETTASKITAAVQQALRVAGEPSSGGVDVIQEDGKFVLRGSVQNEQTKRRVEQAARSASTAAEIENQIRIEKR